MFPCQAVLTQIPLHCWNTEFCEQCDQATQLFLGAFAKSWKASCLSVRLCLRAGQLGFHWTDFHEIWYLRTFRKFIEKIQVSLKSDKNNGYFTWIPIYIFNHIPFSSPWNKKKHFKQNL
jgi:hypothetical protein